ncbi:MAG TPA: SMC-Scp complex subunit ScpB, partial [Anaerovoracaceae bacterium]|nr:SMC-Scp complex subunit ScpB [Anaerovoracaceae bacterium]
GRSTAIGRPILYGTTPGFLAQFGFESLEDLPQIEDIGTLVLSDSYEFSDELTAHQIRIPLEEENKEVAQ